MTHDEYLAQLDTKKWSFAQALLNIVPTAKWIIHNNSYDTIEWLPENTEPIPSREEVESEVQRLHDEWDYNLYARQRANAYPPIADQLDMIFHGGIDAWKEDINRVKALFPK